MQDEIRVQVSGGGSGRGIQDITTGLANIGMASRKVKESEIALFGDGFVEHLIGYDAISVAVSKDVYDAGIIGISSEDLAKIYRGEIDNWKYIRVPGTMEYGPDLKILCVARISGSGTRDTFNEMILGDDRIETEGVDLYTLENAEVKTILVQSNKAIGYIGIGYTKTGDIRAIELDGLEPSLENIRDGNYALARSLYLYTWNGTGENEKTFIDFVLSEKGQNILEEEGFIAV